MKIGRQFSICPTDAVNNVINVRKKCYRGFLLSKSVYSIPCARGAVYIGETGRSVKPRLAEQQRCLQSGMLSRSAIAEHHKDTGHPILFNTTSVEAKSSYYDQRKILEAVEIDKNTIGTTGLGSLVIKLNYRRDGCALLLGEINILLVTRVTVHIRMIYLRTEQLCVK